MTYILLLDHELLDNGAYLKRLSATIGRISNCRFIMLHGDSEYTDRLIQTGMMREDARLRATKELNHRLINLFADDGVAAVGMQAYQRDAVSVIDGDVKVDGDFFGRVSLTHMVVSNLVNGPDGLQPINIFKLAYHLKAQLPVEDVLALHIIGPENNGAGEMSRPGRIPKEAAGSPVDYRICRLEDLSDLAKIASIPPIPAHN